MKSLIVILGGISVFALGACTVNGTSSTSTGSGGGTTTTTAGNGGAGGGATGTGTGTGGAGGCDATLTCASAITPPGDPANLCEGPSAMLYDALAKCTCEGACKAVCGDNSCLGKPASMECTMCLQTDVGGCKGESTACAGDV